MSEDTMKKRVTREEQIEIMKSAPARMERNFAAWMRVPAIRESVVHPEKNGDRPIFEQKTAKVARGMGRCV